MLRLNLPGKKKDDCSSGKYIMHICCKATNTSDSSSIKTLIIKASHFPDTFICQNMFENTSNQGDMWAQLLGKVVAIKDDTVKHRPRS